MSTLSELAHYQQLLMAFTAFIQEATVRIAGIGFNDSNFCDTHLAIRFGIFSVFCVFGGTPSHSRSCPYFPGASSFIFRLDTVSGGDVSD